MENDNDVTLVLAHKREEQDKRTIDALVAALEAAHRTICTGKEDVETIKKIDAALALARGEE